MSYSVWCYLRGFSECQAQGVSFTEASKLFRLHTTNAFAKAGLTTMVRLFDSDYNTIAEWRYRLGIVFGEMPSTKG